MSSSISKRYAVSLYELGLEENILEELHDELDTFCTLLEENRELSSVLFDSSFGKDRKKQVIDAIFDEDDNPYFVNFINLLIDKDRIYRVRRIKTLFDKRYDEYNNVQKVTVKTAQALTDEQRGVLTEKLEKKFEKNIRLKEEIDPRLIGGMIVITKGKILDLSVRTKLDSLKRKLKEN